MARANQDQLTRRVSDGPNQQGKKSYKVLLESVTQEKKKLQTHVSYTERAPEGFTYVPVGVRDLTDYCKEESRKRGLEVYLVSAEPKNKASRNPENISHHVHRIGHHFDNSVVEQGTIRFGYSTHRNNRYRRNNAVNLLGPSNIAQRLERHGKRIGLSHADMSDEQRSEQVRETIKELFPRMPPGDLEAIVRRAFEEGTKRVGNAADLPIPRRVQLAVVAHIRHVYTNYDQLLRQVSYHEARSMVEQPCLDQIVKWRGEQEEDDEVIELEDIFREVIVLDDDDDDEESSDAHGSPSRRNSGMDIRASKVDAGTLDGGNYAVRDPSPEDAHLIRATPVAEIVHVKPKRDHASRRLLQHDEIARRYEESKARQGMPNNAGEATNFNFSRQQVVLPVRGHSETNTWQGLYYDDEGYDQSVKTSLQPASQLVEHSLPPQEREPYYFQVQDEQPGYVPRSRFPKPVYVKSNHEPYKEVAANNHLYTSASSSRMAYPERTIVESIEPQSSGQAYEFVGHKRKPIDVTPLDTQDSEMFRVQQNSSKRPRVETIESKALYYDPLPTKQRDTHTIRPTSSFPLQRRNEPEPEFIDLTYSPPERERRADNRITEVLYERAPPSNAAVNRADTWPTHRNHYVQLEKKENQRPAAAITRETFQEPTNPPPRARRVIYVDELPPHSSYPIDRQPMPSHSENGDQFGWQPAVQNRLQARQTAPTFELREALPAREIRDIPKQPQPPVFVLDGAADGYGYAPPPPRPPPLQQQLPPPTQYDVHPSRRERVSGQTKAGHRDLVARSRR